MAVFHKWYITGREPIYALPRICAYMCNIQTMDMYTLLPGSSQRYGITASIPRFVCLKSYPAPRLDEISKLSTLNDAAVVYWFTNVH